jgi:enoyl-CoA hydratase
MSDLYAPFESLKFDYPAERVLRICLDNPGKLNAVDARMHRELAEVWRAVDTDPDVSAVILTGAGDAFSAGGDFEVLEDLCRSQETRLTVWKEARDIVYNVINCSKPVISAIRGPAVGAGLAAALVADISVASKTARFIDGHTRLGVAAGDHSVIVWPLCSPASRSAARRPSASASCRCAWRTTLSTRPPSASPASSRGARRAPSA